MKQLHKRPDKQGLDVADKTACSYGSRHKLLCAEDCLHHAIITAAYSEGKLAFSAHTQPPPPSATYLLVGPISSAAVMGW